MYVHVYTVLSIPVHVYVHVYSSIAIGTAFLRDRYCTVSPQITWLRVWTIMHVHTVDIPVHVYPGTRVRTRVRTVAMLRTTYIHYTYIVALGSGMQECQWNGQKCIVLHAVELMCIGSTIPVPGATTNHGSTRVRVHCTSLVMCMYSSRTRVLICANELIGIRVVAAKLMHLDEWQLTTTGLDV